MHLKKLLAIIIIIIVLLIIALWYFKFKEVNKSINNESNVTDNDSNDYDLLDTID